jgi:hypothetical protein
MPLIHEVVYFGDLKGSGIRKSRDKTCFTIIPVLVSSYFSEFLQVYLEKYK